MAADAQQLFDDLTRELAPLGARAARMFGMPCLKDPDGKAFVGLRGEELVVRLNGDTEQHAEALAVKGAHLLDPMGGRPMRDWICLPAAAHAEWSGYAAAARAMPR